MIREFLKFWLAMVVIVFGMAAFTHMAKAKGPLDEPLAKFAEEQGFDLCAPLISVTAVIEKPWIAVLMLNINDAVYPYAYIGDAMSGEVFYVQFYETTVGDVACLKQVWSGMFRDASPSSVPYDPTKRSA